MSPDECKSTDTFSGGYKFPESHDEYKSTYTFSGCYKYLGSPDECKSTDTFSGGYKFILCLQMSVKALIPAVVVISKVSVLLHSTGDPRNL